MATGSSRAGSLPALGLFYCGLAVIVAATVLNIVHDRIIEPGLSALPPFLASMYEMSGKLGVTVTLVTAGMSIILVSLVMLRSRARAANAVPTPPATETPYFCTPSTEELPPGTTSSGTMILQTRKYMQK